MRLRNNESHDDHRRRETEGSRMAHHQYNLRPRSKVDNPQFTLATHATPNLHRPSPTALLRHYGYITYSTQELGCGAYSKVYKATQNGREVAVKVVRLDLVGEVFKRDFLPREQECWSKVRHRNVCELYACHRAYDYLFMFMEYCSGGDLLSFIRTNGQIPQANARRWMKSLLDAVCYLHKKNLAHRDIKAENVLISKYNSVKLADFGFACEKPTRYSATYCGSRSYSSPELLKGVPYDIFKNDVWSFGVLCFVTMTSSMPFHEHPGSNSLIIEQQRRKDYRWPSAIPQEYCQSIDVMLTFDPQHRPLAKDCKNFPYFKPTLEGS